MQKSLNDIGEETLKEIENLASHFFTPREIAMMLELNEEDFVKAVIEENIEPVRRFKKGWMQAEYDLRHCIKQLALSGSSPAQNMMMELFKSARLKMLDK